MTNNLYPQDTGETPGHATPRENAAMSGAILCVDSALEYVGAIGVDSGQVLLIDPLYLRGDDPERLLGECWNRESGTDAKPIGVLPLGLPLAIGCEGFGGDGHFPAYVTRDENGQVASLQVHFTRDPEAHTNLFTVVGTGTIVHESAITDAALLADLVADYQASLDGPDGGGS